MLIPDLRELLAGAWPQLSDSERAQVAKALMPYDLFRLLYWSDPLGFVQNCIEWRPDEEGPSDYQSEILAAFPEARKVSVRGPHSLGKTAVSAWLILWFVLTRDGVVDWKVVTTAGSWHQLVRYLWPEIHKWAEHIQWDVVGRSPFSRMELLIQTIKGSTGMAFAIATERPEMIEGAHATALMYVFDESKSIPDSIFDAAEGAFANVALVDNDIFAFSISTPGESHGRFYDIQVRKPGYEDWFVRHVSMEEAKRAGRISETWQMQRAAQWGADSALYINHVLGEFCSSNPSISVIPTSWIEAANDRWNDWTLGSQQFDFDVPLVLGVDIGRGGDKTVIACRRGQVITKVLDYNVADLMRVAGYVKVLIDEALEQGIFVVTLIDVIGIGAGVLDRLREQGCYVLPFNVSNSTDMTDDSGELRFPNVRGASWWNARQLLDPAYGSVLAIPPHDTLISDLGAPTWKPTSSGQIQVESKDQVKHRLGRSPDYADAVISAFWYERAEGMIPYRGEALGKTMIGVESQATRGTEAFDEQLARTSSRPRVFG
jgi:hypothetical protein